MHNREIAMPLIATLIIGAGLITLSSIGMSQGFFNRQVVGVGLSCVPLLLMLWFGRSRLYQFTVPIYALSLLLLVSLVVFGKEVNGNKNWLVFGPLQFQPLEFAKIGMVLMLARYMREPIRTLRDYVPIGIIALPVLVITLGASGDFGGTLVLCTILFGMMVVRGIDYRHVLLGVAVLAVAVPTVVWPKLKDYQKDRLTSFLNPEADPRGRGYQVLQSKIAIGSGGFFGKGYRKGKQSQLGYVPEEQNDFIFAPLAEEQGFIGGAILMLLYGALFWRMATMGNDCSSETDRLVIGGIMCMLAFQILENLGAAMGIAPVTGLTLPLVSYGNSSLIAVVLALAVVYVVHRDRFEEF